MELAEALVQQAKLLGQRPQKRQPSQLLFRSRLGGLFTHSQAGVDRDQRSLRDQPPGCQGYWCPFGKADEQVEIAKNQRWIGGSNDRRLRSQLRLDLDRRYDRQHFLRDIEPPPRRLEIDDGSRVDRYGGEEQAHRAETRDEVFELPRAVRGRRAGWLLI